MLNTLLIIFAGWGMDENPFSDLMRDDCDIKIIYDYRREVDLKDDFLNKYNEINIVAWSFGVPAATRFIISHPNLPITAKIAINGTNHPVDDSFGIPQAIFQATLRNLSPASLLKFYRRMCGNPDRYQNFIANAPSRSIENLAEELQAIAINGAVEGTDARGIWTAVYIGSHDLVIPTKNQIRAWEGHPDVRIIDEPHLPDFNKIINSAIPNKKRIIQKFTQSSETYDTNSPVQSAMARRLAELWHTHRSNIPLSDMVEIGAGTGKFTREMLRYFSPKKLTLFDLSPIPAAVPGTHKIADAEIAIRHFEPESLDAIASSATIQWFSSIPDYISYTRKALRSNGQIALSTFTTGHFAEIHDFLPSPIHYLSPEQWEAILCRFFKIECIVQEPITLSFDTPRHLLTHLRDTGVNAMQPSPSAARAIINHQVTTLTYRPIYIIATKKTEARRIYMPQVLVEN